MRMIEKEGVNVFTNYDKTRFFIDHIKKGKSAKSLQVSWGGFAYFDEGNMKNDLANYNLWVKRFFFNKSKDGYFNKRFIYVNDLHESSWKKYSGAIFPKVFLFLEEEYEKRFIVDYLKTLFEQIDQYHKTQDRIKFVKYNDRNKV